VNEKYLAGFIDADGYVSVRARVGARPDLEVGIAQRQLYSDPLEYAHDEFGGRLEAHDIEGVMHAKLSLRCGPARQLLERLSKYMVLKRHHAEQMIALVDSSPVLKTREEVLRVREQVKAIRAQGASSIPNFPSRKWLAGYFDGDGCFSVKVEKVNGYGYAHAAILAAKNYTAGIVLLHQAFGGRINGTGQNATWSLQLEPSKAREFLPYFAQHLVIKKAQAYFLLGCAEHNFRDGITVRDTIKTLNSQQHRLSDPAATAAELVKQVDFNIQKKPQGRPKGAKDLKPRKPRSKR
jgi:hypothetical protein